MLKRCFAVIPILLMLMSSCGISASAKVKEYPFNVCYDEETSRIFNENGRGLLFGFDYDSDDGYWYSSLNAWQRTFGYSKVYDDLAFLIGCYYDTVRICFEYDEKEWLIQYWKGIYGFTSGAEIGVYNRPSGSKGSFYKCISDDEMPRMKLFVKAGDDVFISQPSQEHWWLTGFVMMSRVPSSDLHCEMMIDFENPEIAKLLSDGLKRNGYNDKNSVVLNGTAVTFSW